MLAVFLALCGGKNNNKYSALNTYKAINPILSTLNYLIRYVIHISVAEFNNIATIYRNDFAELGKQFRRI